MPLAKRSLKNGGIPRRGISPDFDMRLSIISLEARWMARLPDGRRAFVKASGSDVPSWRSEAAHRLDRDRACLDALAGLAVPRRVRLPSAPLLAGLSSRAALAEEWVHGRALDRAGLSAAELLGAWAFVAEQLVAFRRREVLYSDVKCANVLARRRPLSVTLIDFDFATAVSPDGRYRTRDLGYTPGFEAPEQLSRRVVGERALVYQLGMLLLHCWTGGRNDELAHPERGLPRLKRDLARMGARAAAELAADCLAERPVDRPSGYEDVLRRLRAPRTLPEPAERIWATLRAPFARALGEVLLER